MSKDSIYTTEEQLPDIQAKHEKKKHVLKTNSSWGEKPTTKYLFSQEGRNNNKEKILIYIILKQRINEN